MDEIETKGKIVSTCLSGAQMGLIDEQKIKKIDEKLVVGEFPPPPPPRPEFRQNYKKMLRICEYVQ